MSTITKEMQEGISPDQAIEMLKEGNQRFLNKNEISRDLHAQVKATSGGQNPYAAVLSCIDSRVPVELAFDQGIGDIFSARVAGNIINEDILGSIEYACGVAGSKAILVLGHTKCGAVTAACQGVELGNITALLSKVKPAIKEVEERTGEIEVEEVTKSNVQQSIVEIREKSTLLSDLEKEGKIKIVGAIYHVENGMVSFL
ncbi:MAG: carbonic anhydrase [Flavobacteriales bacterium]|jgi:carbonic anhydrase|nr:carbonic anhydrase [Flavobacteriales bacterium]MBT5933423.1 carbonic anhydrase [Flavobacteriales bacterium]MDO7610802.1 carbonic anhydrase family protein [Crocinitomicaceae bacterium]MDO7613885.1 carbonic anhydrase family protein [Crocinitomicaceae bacterium]